MEKELEAVIDEVRLLFNALVQRGERLHEGEDLTMAMRAVLEFLHRSGPTAVPFIARSRRVSRQHIQAQVNALLESGRVEARDNPAHRRSPLIALTRDGERTIRRVRRREEALFGEAELGLSEAQLRRVASSLGTIRRAIEG